MLRNIMIVLFLLLFTGMAYAEDLTLQWYPSPSPNIAGYKIYYGYHSREYVMEMVKDVGNSLEYTLTGIDPGIRMFYAVTAYNTSGYESDYSRELAHTILGPIKPTNLTYIGF